jgi:hypothetical protein
MRNISMFYLYRWGSDEITFQFQYHQLLPFKGKSFVLFRLHNAHLFLDVSPIFGITFEGNLQNRDPSILSECSPQRFL